MRRLPSPWITAPVLVGTAVGGAVGFLVTEVSCNPGSCTAAAAGMGILSALVAFLGIGTVVVLAVRSIAEWRALSERDEPETPPAGPDSGRPTC